MISFVVSPKSHEGFCACSAPFKLSQPATGIRLAHTTGFLTCSTNEQYHAECPDSNWGTWTGSVTAADANIPDTLNTWITDGHDNPVAPFADPNDSAFCSSRGMCGSGWYAAGEGSTPPDTHWQSHTLQFDQDFPRERTMSTVVNI